MIIPLLQTKKDLSGIKGYGYKKCVEQRYVWHLNFLIFDQLGRKHGKSSDFGG